MHSAEAAVRKDMVQGFFYVGMHYGHVESQHSTKSCRRRKPYRSECGRSRTQYAPDEVLHGNETRNQSCNTYPWMLLAPWHRTDIVKARFTTFLFGGTAGKIKPTFSIIKCSSTNAVDLSGTRVVANLLREPGFSAADGLRAKLWQKHVALPNRKGGVENKLYKRPYVVNERTGDVVCLCLCNHLKLEHLIHSSRRERILSIKCVD